MGLRGAPASRESGKDIVSSWGAYVGAVAAFLYVPQVLGIDDRPLDNHAGGVNVWAVALGHLWRHFRGLALDFRGWCLLVSSGTCLDKDPTVAQPRACKPNSAQGLSVRYCIQAKYERRASLMQDCGAVWV